MVTGYRMRGCTVIHLGKAVPTPVRVALCGRKLPPQSCYEVYYDDEQDWRDDWPCLQCGDVLARAAVK